MKKEKYQLDGDPYKFMQQLINAKKSFTISLTNSSAKIEIGNKILNFGEKWKPETLGLFSKTNAHLSKQPLPEMPSEIKYINLTPPESTFEAYDKVCALDISAAYHSAALILGYFTPELKKAHLKAGKMERLQAFGATAKRAEVFTYINGELRHEEPSENPNRPFFQNCAAYVGEALEEVRSQLGKDFIFYWVDCAFFIDSEKNREIARKVFNKAGFEVHLEKADLLIYRRDFKKHTIERYSDGEKLEYNLPIFDAQKLAKRKFEARNKIRRFNT